MKNAFSSSAKLFNWATRVALLATLLFALVPTASRLIAQYSGGQSFVQICTAHGLMWVQLDSDKLGSGQKQSSSIQKDSCPFCAPQLGVADLPPVVALVVPVDLLVIDTLQARLLPLSFDHRYSLPLARGPPSFISAV